MLYSGLNQDRLQSMTERRVQVAQTRRAIGPAIERCRQVAGSAASEDFST